MTEQGEQELAGHTAQLRKRLEPLQAAVLDTVWQAVVTASWSGTQVWPTWDYVCRSLYQTHSELEDAVALFASLPTVPSKPGTSGPYGLAWHTGHSAFPPSPEDRVGLTIAGIRATSKPGGGTASVADDLALLIRALADMEAKMPLDPDSVAKADLSLADIIGGLTQRTRERPVTLTEPVIAVLLQHEYAPLQVFESEPGHYQVGLGRLTLRTFRTVASADTYLDIVERDSRACLPDEALTSPLTLVQTLDYLGYVLSADPSWHEKQRLTQAPDLQSAAAFTTEVTTQPEYQTALNSVWNVISQLHVPSLSKEEMAARGDRHPPGSIERLDFWLERRLEDDPAAIARVRRALGVVRAVGRVRVEADHRSNTTIADGAKARAILGLPEFVYDFGGAWRTICGRLAGAFDVIRQEVGAAPRPESGVE